MKIIHLKTIFDYVPDKDVIKRFERNAINVVNEAMDRSDLLIEEKKVSGE